MAKVMAMAMAMAMTMAMTMETELDNNNNNGKGWQTDLASFRAEVIKSMDTLTRVIAKKLENNHRLFTERMD